MIARALASESEFILLDEPLVGIDRDARNSFLKLLDNLCHEKGKTILMVSHDLTAIRQTAHRMIFLERGSFDSMGQQIVFPIWMYLQNCGGLILPVVVLKLIQWRNNHGTRCRSDGTPHPSF